VVNALPFEAVLGSIEVYEVC